MKSQTPPTPPASPDDAPDSWLSALVDGEGTQEALDRACAGWSIDLPLRQTWHAYHLIGDVMRSEELAPPPGRDQDFLAGVRARLAAEPVVLAPSAPLRRPQPWLMPAAMVAGVAVVAGVLVLARGPMSGPARVLAAASSPSIGPGGVPPLAGGSGSAGPMSLRPLVNEGGMLRDARLDEFLRAHDSVGPGMTMAVPGGSLRRVDIVAPADIGR